MVGGREVTPPAHSRGQGLDLSSFPSKNVVLDLDLGLVQSQPFVSCASLGQLRGFSELWFTHLENEAKNVPIPQSSWDLKAPGAYAG